MKTAVSSPTGPQPRSAISPTTCVQRHVGARVHALPKLLRARSGSRRISLVRCPPRWQAAGALDGYPIDASGRVVEHRGALGSGIALRQPFEGVVHHVVGVRHLVDREVALEHAAVGAELLDAV